MKYREIMTEAAAETEDWRERLATRRFGKPEGYWAASQEDTSKYPFPVAGQEWTGQQKFIARLLRVQKAARRQHEKGDSVCRICGKPNGSDEYSYQGRRWPQGYLHYIQDHNVKPSQEFYEFVMNLFGDE